MEEPAPEKALTAYQFPPERDGEKAVPDSIIELKDFKAPDPLPDSSSPAAATENDVALKES